MLEYLSDDLSSVTSKDKNTGSLLSQDEKEGIERLIEGLQLIPWSSMERQTQPAQKKVVAPSQALAQVNDKKEQTEETKKSSAKPEGPPATTKAILLERPKLDQVPKHEESCEAEVGSGPESHEQEVKKRMQKIQAEKNTIDLQMFPDDEPLTE